MSNDSICVLVTPRVNNDRSEFRVARCSIVNNLLSNKVVNIDGEQCKVADLYKVIYFGNSPIYTTRLKAFLFATAIEESLCKKEPRIEKGIRFINCKQPFPNLNVDEAYRLREKLL